MIFKNWLLLLNPLTNPHKWISFIKGLIFTAVLFIAVAASFRVYLLEGEISAITQEHLQLLATSEADAREREHAIASRYQKALNEDRARRIKLERVVAGTRMESGRLRNAIEAANRRASTASEAAVRDYAVTVGHVLGDCQQRYQSLAQEADGHANDVKTLIEAWPRFEKPVPVVAKE